MEEGVWGCEEEQQQVTSSELRGGSPSTPVLADDASMSLWEGAVDRWREIDQQLDIYLQKRIADPRPCSATEPSSRRSSNPRAPGQPRRPAG
ncbi:unnamed protein product [Discosporangium mesarthrocarpum]